MAHSPSRPTTARIFVLTMAGAAACLAGCKKHYRVTDLETGDIYYTDHINRNNAQLSGVLQFVDEASGAMINLDDFEYKKIGRKAFKRGLTNSQGVGGGQ